MCSESICMTDGFVQYYFWPMMYLSPLERILQAFGAAFEVLGTDVLIFAIAIQVSRLIYCTFLPL